MTSIHPDWINYLRTGTAVLVCLMIFGVGLRHWGLGGKAHWLVAIGGIITSLIGLTNQTMIVLFNHQIISMYDPSGSPSAFYTVFQNTGLAFMLGQLVFFAGLLLAASSLRSEKRRITELEAIIMERDRSHEP
jgi:hypothetical protein